MKKKARKKPVSAKNKERGNHLMQLRISLNFKLIQVSKETRIPVGVLWDMECGRFNDSKAFHGHLFATDGDVTEQRLLKYYEDYWRDVLTQNSIDFLFWCWWGFLKGDPRKYPGRYPLGYVEMQENYQGEF